MIALGGPKLKRNVANLVSRISPVSMIALGGPKLKLVKGPTHRANITVSMIALGGPKLKPKVFTIRGADVGTFQ